MNEIEYVKPHSKDDSETTARFRQAVEMAIAERKAAGLPIVRYDRTRKIPYLEYPDGRIEYKTPDE